MRLAFLNLQKVKNKHTAGDERDPMEEEASPPPLDSLNNLKHGVMDCQSALRKIEQHSESLLKGIDA